MKFSLHIRNSRFKSLLVFIFVAITACANTVQEKKSNQIYSRHVCDLGALALNSSINELSSKYGKIISKNEIQMIAPDWTLLNLRFSSGVLAEVAITNSQKNESMHILSLTIDSSNVETGAVARIGDSVEILFKKFGARNAISRHITYACDMLTLQVYVNKNNEISKIIWAGQID